ncbi:hypothetical protein AMTRI_Chr01g115070 [Amborella trichopoda]
MPVGAGYVFWEHLLGTRFLQLSKLDYVLNRARFEAIALLNIRDDKKGSRTGHLKSYPVVIVVVPVQLPPKISSLKGWLHTFLLLIAEHNLSSGLLYVSKLMAWALQSDSQDDLCNSLLSNEPCWQEMRNLGLGFWLTSGTSLRARMEKLARLQFLKRKDPKECALLYLALNRQQVLAGLFKISKDERDKPLVGFLSPNFQEEKNKSAALKNAYVLLGRHQLELAAAFFLLGGDLSSAIAVCTKNIGDEQLALVICELVEGTNGPVQHELILNYLLPSAIEKEENWLASMLEWRLGKYSQSILRLLHVAVDLTVEEKILDLPGTHFAFLDPDVGQYCAILSAKRSLRNSIGESSADTLARWAIIMTSIALNKCGLPLEALGCLSPSISNSDGKEPSVYSSNGSELKSTSKDASYNWLSGSLASCFESHAKLNLAMQYISKIIREHPNWERFKLVGTHQFIPLLEELEKKLKTGISVLDERYSVKATDLKTMMFVFSCNNGMLFLGYHVLQCLLFPKHTHDLFNISDSVASVQLDLLLKAAEEICNGFAHCVVGYNITVSAFIPAPKLSDGCRRSSITQLNAWDFYLESLQHSLGTLRLFLKVLNSNGLLIDDITLKASDVLDHLEYCIRFASAWLRRNPEDLLMMSQPISNGLNGIPSSSEFNTAPLRVNLVVHNDSFAVDNELPVSASRPQLHNFTDARVHLVPSDERWQLIGTLKTGDSSDVLLSGEPSRCYSFGRTHSLKPIDLLPSLLSELLLNALAYTSSGLNKEFSFFIRLKLEKDLPNQEIGKSEMFPNEKSVMPCDILWNVFASQEDVREILTKEKIKFYQTLGRKSPRGWKDVQICIIAKDENDDTIGHHQEGGARNISDGRNWIFDGNSFLGTKRKSVSPPRDRVSSFNYPKEVFKRNGELLEAICINSCDQNQVAVASNRKLQVSSSGRLKKGKEYAQGTWLEVVRKDMGIYGITKGIALNRALAQLARLRQSTTSTSNTLLALIETKTPSALSLSSPTSGARSLAVFDHDIGSASISPLLQILKFHLKTPAPNENFLWSGAQRKHKFHLIKPDNPAITPKSKFPSSVLTMAGTRWCRSQLNQGSFWQNVFL